MKKTWSNTGPKEMMVPEACAIYHGAPGQNCFGVPIEADHRSLVRFRDVYDVNYAPVQNHLPRFASAAPNAIKGRLKRIAVGRYMSWNTGMYISLNLTQKVTNRCLAEHEPIVSPITAQEKSRLPPPTPSHPEDSASSQVLLWPTEPPNPSVCIERPDIMRILENALASTENNQAQVLLVGNRGLGYNYLPGFLKLQ